MNQKCVEIEAIGDILDLPSDDPRRRHLEDCPRCNALLVSYQTFLKAESVPGSDRADARARLRAFLQSEIEQPSTDVVDKRPARDPYGFFATLFRTFTLRPAQALAAVLVIVLGLVWWQPWVQEQPVLRGPQLAPGTSGPLGLYAPQATEAGGFQLSWQPLQEADSYQVRLYRPDLTELIRFDSTSDTTLVVHPSMLPSGAPRIVVWRVIALQQGDEIDASQPASLEFE